MANKYSAAIEEAEKQIDSLKIKLEGLHKSILDNAKEFNNIFKGGGADLKVIKAQIELVNKQMALLNKENQNAIVTEKKLQAEIKTKNDLLRLEHNEIKKNITIKKEQERQSKLQAQALEKEQKETLRQTTRSTELNRAYVKLVNQQKQAKNVLLDLMVVQGKNSKETRRAQREYDRLTKRVNEANKATKNFTIGGLNSMAAGFKNILSAFGVMGGIQIFANIVKDTFQRVREFDKSMQNLAGVFRTTREELKPLEEDIISVAGQSVKTSREVADLAESLATLGKTPEQIRKLLKPVVDLGIGLESTSENAGEFLIQMLNAFGASESEAMKYADTIATIRTSTTLDFQKMRDSFQYIAPIAKLLGKDLAYTGSVVGILADNGLKAQQAGRVLGTSLQKLAVQGLTLDDALIKINNASANGAKEVELLAMANRLLGAEGAKIGIILAENKDIIDKNTESIRSNSGALEDLVEQQMESLDAKLLVLDASWEELILRIENGKGVFSTAFKDIIEGATDFLNVLSDINQVTEIIGKNEEISFWQKIFPPAGLAKGINDFARVRDATKEFQAIQKEFNTIDLTNLNEVYSGIDIWTDMKKEVEGNIEATQILDYFLNKLKETERTIYEEARNADDERRKNEKNKQKKIEEEINRNNKLNKYLVGSIAYYEKQISLAKESIQNSTLSSDGYKKQSKSIEDATKKIKELKKALGIRDESSVLDLTPKGLDDGKEKLSEFQKDLIDFLETLKETEEVPEMMPLSDETIERLKEYNKTLQETKDKAEQLKALKGIFKEVTGTFSEMFDIDVSKFDFLFDNITNTVEDWAKLSKELIGGVLDASLQRYEIELQTAQRNRDLVLNNELASEEAKENARVKFREKERQINTEKAKAERDNALIKIAVDTAVGVAMATANYLSNPLTAPALPFILPIIIGTGLLQAGIVASQPLPQFEKGGTMGKDGWAITQEKRPEPIVDKKGNLKTMGSYGGDSLTYLEQGDKVFKSREDFLKQFNMDNINTAVFDMNMFSNGQLLQKNEVDNSLLIEMGSLRKDIDTMGKRIEKMASRPIKVNNKVELKDNRAY